MSRRSTILVAASPVFLLLTGLAARSFAERPLCLTVDDHSLSVSDGERLLIEYRYAATPFKPYMTRWLTPRGVNILRDAPVDHRHHHALMFAIGVDGVNYWEEVEGAGRQNHGSLDDLRSVLREGCASARFTHQLEWQAPGQPHSSLRERRSIKVLRAPGIEASLLSWSTTLEATKSGATTRLEGRHYFGLGMRFVESMDSGGRFLTESGEEGDVVRGTERLVHAKWCAYQAEVDGVPVTVAMFGHPSNPRGPTTWFTMTAPFAYLSATLDLSREALVLDSGQTLNLKYGLALWDGHVDERLIDSLYTRWLQLREEDADP